MLHETIYLREAENRKDVYLKTYVREKLDFDSPRPAVVVCPGGGYGYCSLSEGEPVALKFMTMGYHAFVLRYTVRSLTNDPFTDDSPYDTTWPQPLFDLASAILTVKEHAAEWNVDPEQIVIIGFSAGGHLAGMYATQWFTPLLQERFGKPAEAFKIKAAMLIYAVNEWLDLDSGGMGDPLRKRLMGKEHPTQEDVHALSPACLVTEKTVPCFVVHAQNDGIVPAEGALHMVEQLRKHKIPVALHVFEEGDHGFALAHQSSACFELELHPDTAVWAELADKWLQKRLHVTLETVVPWADKIK